MDVGIHGDNSNETVVKLIDFEDAHYVDKNGDLILEKDEVVTRQAYPWVDPALLQSSTTFNAKASDGLYFYLWNFPIIFLSLCIWLLVLHHFWKQKMAKSKNVNSSMG